MQVKDDEGLNWGQNIQSTQEPELVVVMVVEVGVSSQWWLQNDRLKDGGIGLTKKRFWEGEVLLNKNEVQLQRKITLGSCIHIS